jgi:hypothetical protein
MLPVIHWWWSGASINGKIKRNPVCGFGCEKFPKSAKTCHYVENLLK